MLFFALFLNILGFFCCLQKSRWKKKWNVTWPFERLLTSTSGSPRSTFIKLNFCQSLNCNFCRTILLTIVAVFRMSTLLKEDFLRCAPFTQSLSEKTKDPRHRLLDSTLFFRWHLPEDCFQSAEHLVSFLKHALTNRLQSVIHVQFHSNHIYLNHFRYKVWLYSALASFLLVW